MDEHRDIIAEAVAAEMATWAERGFDAQMVNAGNCDLFASGLLRRLGRTVPLLDERDIGDFLMEESEDEDEATLLNRERLERDYDYQPPEGMTWEDLDDLALFCCWSSGTHVWVSDGTRHYDSECPEGVDNFLDLPIFKRHIDTWRQCRHVVAP
jgi:hypothetical protein